jgi:uncharacterized protein YjbJ (UPF0337 family)
MNSDILKGKWAQMKGDLKARWGKLTDDEWTEIGGNKDTLIGKIQEKYGRTKDDVSREVDEFFNDYDRRSGGTVGSEPDLNTGKNRKVS